LHDDGHWFTSSTSFANPAVTVGRGLTNTFSGIDPTHVAAFVAVQLIAAVVATLCFRWLLEEQQAEAEIQGDP
jgi:glycerol uptake facilitator-like aquaporin